MALPPRRSLILRAAVRPPPAAADIVRLTNGRTMTVDRCRFEGDTVVLVMRGGGEIRAPRRTSSRVLPDEVPWARETALEALALSPSAATHPARTPSCARPGRAGGRAGRPRRPAGPRRGPGRVELQPLAVSPEGRHGPHADHAGAGPQYRLADPFDPEQNLEAGHAGTRDACWRSTSGGPWRPTTPARARSAVRRRAAVRETQSTCSRHHCASLDACRGAPAPSRSGRGHGGSNGTCDVDPGRVRP